MKPSSLRLTYFAALLAVAFAANSALTAPPGGKGGGAGDDGGSEPPALPTVGYQFNVVPVDELDRLEGVNDLGQCVGAVRVLSANTTIDTVEERAAVMVDTYTGQVNYLDNLIDAAEPWDLYVAYAINNQGQIVGAGVKNGVFVARAFLLNPRSDGSGYDLVDLGSDGTSTSALDISQAGDVLLRSWDTSTFNVVMNDGSVNDPLPSPAWYSGINSLGMVLGGYTEGGMNTGEVFYSDFTGVTTTLELLPYMTFRGDAVLSESGYSFGWQSGPWQKIKGQVVGGTKWVTYDPQGYATEESLGFSINGNYHINAQVVDGVPLIAGTQGDGRTPWIRFPGYAAVAIPELMDAAEWSALDSLLVDSDTDFMISTPRDETGAVYQDGAPSLFGRALEYEDANGLAYEGIYVISPILP